jgi:predicted nucleotidyltransferase
MILEPDFLDFIRLLNRHRVKYLIVGAHALAFYGHPRNTGDLDIWVKPSEENASKLIDVLIEFGFGSLKLTKEDFMKENYVTQLGDPPLRIDILNSISGVSFDDAYTNKMEGVVEGVTIKFIGIMEFLANKRATGRPKDLGDINELEQ